MKLISHSSEETKKFAKNLAKDFQSGIIALTGDLGSGKTTFALGFAEGLGIKTKIISPTFVLVRQHPIPKTKKILYHIDLYRLDTDKHIIHSGIEEILNDQKDVILVEWAQKAKNLLPKGTRWISFKTIGENSREITVH